MINRQTAFPETNKTCAVKLPIACYTTLEWSPQVTAQHSYQQLLLTFQPISSVVRRPVLGLHVFVPPLPVRTETSLQRLRRQKRTA